MASFWLDPNTNKRYYLNRPFEYQNVNYTKSGASSTKFTELGFSEVLIKPRPNDRYYIVSGPDNAGEYTKTPRSLPDLKTALTREVKLKSRQLLRKTDWLVVRKAENDTTIPAAVESFRDNVRTIADDNCTLINNTSTVEELESLVTASLTIEDPSNPGTYIANQNALSAMPDEVSGYDY